MNDQPNVCSCVIVGIAGPSGSGKSYFAEQLLQAMPDRRGVVLSQDYYYRDRSDLTFEERQEINYDHPDALEFSLLKLHLQQLRRGEQITHPLYDFSQHNRQQASAALAPADVVVVDGILLFSVPELMPLFDLKIYVNTPLDICFIRRLQRDVQERGRTVESVIHQYMHSVRPMFLEFVRPSRIKADLVVEGEGSIKRELKHVLDQLDHLFPNPK